MVFVVFSCNTLDEFYLGFEETFRLIAFQMISSPTTIMKDEQGNDVIRFDYYAREERVNDTEKNNFT